MDGVKESNALLDSDSTTKDTPVRRGPEEERPRFGLIVCFALFGITSFVLSNALWVELPLLYREAPEGPRLAAYLILSLQLANVVPAVYMYCRTPRQQEQSLVAIIYTLLLGGVAAACLLGLFHAVLTTVGGQSRSLTLFALVFLSACVSNTTNVTYFPFVARYPKVYTTALLTGEGLSGFVAGMCGILQNSGGISPRFSVRCYFFYIAGIFVVGTTAFTYIILHGRALYTPEAAIRAGGGGGYGAAGSDSDASPAGAATAGGSTGGRGSSGSPVLEGFDGEGDSYPGAGGGYGRVGNATGEGRYGDCEDWPSPAAPAGSGGSGAGGGEGSGRGNDFPLAPPGGNGGRGGEPAWKLVLPLLLQQGLLASAAYGLIPSISPIMVQGYRRPASALMWANVLGMVADPVARALTFFIEFYGFWLLTPSAVMLAGVLVACAAAAPTPPLWEARVGAALPVACYTGFQFLTGFTLTMAFLAIRRRVGEGSSEAAYRWGGVMIQAGAFTGTMVGFLLVIVFNVFYTGYR